MQNWKENYTQILLHTLLHIPQASLIRHKKRLTERNRNLKLRGDIKAVQCINANFVGEIFWKQCWNGIGVFMRFAESSVKPDINFFKCFNFISERWYGFFKNDGDLVFFKLSFDGKNGRLVLK